jgi:hypothetical protein
MPVIALATWVAACISAGPVHEPTADTGSAAASTAPPATSTEVVGLASRAPDDLSERIDSYVCRDGGWHVEVLGRPDQLSSPGVNWMQEPIDPDSPWTVYLGDADCESAEVTVWRDGFAVEVRSIP